MMSAATGFQSDKAGQQLCNKGSELFSAELPFQDRLTRFIDAMKLKAVFCQIDSQQLDVPFYAIFFHGFPRFCFDVGLTLTSWPI